MPAKKKRRSRRRGNASAPDILFERYIKGKPERIESLREVSAAMSLGEYIRDLRERKEITQKQLADAIGTQRTAISRLESADYSGHSIELLCRIAGALHGNLVVRIETESGPDRDKELVIACR